MSDDGASPFLDAGRSPGARRVRRFDAEARARRLLPLKLTVVYLFATYALFISGIIHWPIDDWTLLNFYLAACALSFSAAYVYSADAAARGAPFPYWRIVFVIGGLSTAALLFPSSIIYTGRWPWQVLEAWNDQREAYTTMLEQLALTEGQRLPVALLRGVAGPFVMATLPLGILNWKRLNGLERSLIFTTIASYLIFSILRGTSRQMADVFVLCSVAGAIAYYRARFATERRRRPPKWGFWALTGAGALLAAGFVQLFAVRIAERMGGAIDLCMMESGICVDFNAPVMSYLPVGFQYIFGALTTYLAQGYYGLHLALQKDFSSTWGVGHSSALIQLYTILTGDAGLYERSFVFRLRENNWSDLYQWSTTLTWFANDIGFFGAILLLFPLGRIFALSWIDATDGRDDRAAVLFSLLAIQMFFFTSNSQLLQTLDGYLAILFWLALWLFGRGRRAIAP